MISLTCKEERIVIDRQYDIRFLWFIHQCRVEYERDFCRKNEIACDISDDLWIRFKKDKKLTLKTRRLGEVQSIFYYIIRDESFINHYRGCKDVSKRLKEFILGYDDVMSNQVGTREFFQKIWEEANSISSKECPGESCNGECGCDQDCWYY